MTIFFISPKMKRARALKPITSGGNGFSMPEVLVSSSILMMVVAGISQSQINSINMTADSSQNNSIQARISEDIDNLHRETFRWMCKPATACTGDPQYADVPMRYLTDKNSILGQDGGHCETKTLAMHMTSEQPQTFPAGPHKLNWDENAPANSKKVTINRNITANGNVMTVSYITTGSSKEVTSTVTLVPQAIHWCA